MGTKQPNRLNECLSYPGALRVVAKRLLGVYLKIAVGVILFLLPLYGLNALIGMSSVPLPASVVCMLVLFFGLLLGEQVAGTKRIEVVLGYLGVPANFCLKWMPIMFTPSFTLLPLAQAVTIAEAFKIAGVFVVGYLVLMVAVAYFVWGLQKLSPVKRRPQSEDSQPSQDVFEMIASGRKQSVSNAALSHLVTTSAGPPPRSTGINGDLNSINNNGDLNSINTNGDLNSINTNSINGDVTNKDDSDDTSIDDSDSDIKEESESDEAGPSDRDVTHTIMPVKSNASSMISLTEPPRAFTSTNSTAPVSTSSATIQQFDRVMSINSASVDRQIFEKKARKGPKLLVKYVDWMVYASLVVAGLPVYYTTGYAMPLHLGTIVLLFYCAMLIPAKARKVLNPIIVSGSSAILFIYIYGVIRGESLHTAISAYKTGRNYLHLFESYPRGTYPGAGDVLSTLLDVSIVALALPMYNYRSDLKRHYLPLILSAVLAGLASFFVYPPVSYAIGIAPERALAFIARSATLALALPIVQAIQGSVQMISVVAILSGIVAPLFGNFLLGKCLRVRNDDFVTRGITFGISSSAVASTMLLETDPRAAALSSLSFFLYGIVMIILSAIPVVVNTVRSWVDLGPIAA